MVWRQTARLFTNRRLATAAGLAAAGALALPSSLCERATATSTIADTAARRPPPSAAPSPPPQPHHDDGLPIYSKAEIAEHVSPERGVWVTFQGGVYDITAFVQNHPGGIEKIMTAAGQSVEPYWSLYRQHLMPAAAGQPPAPKQHVAEILAPLKIGRMDPAELAAERTSKRAVDDPYANEPERHAALKLISETPCSGETPQTLVNDNWLTPNGLFFVRNHHPVPRIDEAAYQLRVEGLGVTAHTFGLDELKRLPKAEVTATLQCGGNRRGGLDEVKRTSGNAWGAGAISNATWGGVYLRDVLAHCGLQSPMRRGVRHVQFEGDDGTKASIPATKAFSEYGDVLLAYEMNGEPLPPDHGFPLRAVVPGHVGVRNIKWLTKVVASDEEAEGVWQRGIAYKSFGPSVTSLEGVDVAKGMPMQEMPVQSVITSPVAGAAVDEGEELTMRGFAWSGGGRGITRVECSADGGATWHTATLTDGAEQPLDRAWAWTFWECDVPVPPAPPQVAATPPPPPDEGRTTREGAAAPPEAGTKPPSRVTLAVRAVDAAFNTQPPDAAQVWNLRGLANNSWHRVTVQLSEE